MLSITKIWVDEAGRVHIQPIKPEDFWMSPDRHCSSCNTTHNPDEACPLTPTSLLNSMNRDEREKSPFNSPREPALPPYHLRNGIQERAEIDRHETEHRRRMGMQSHQFGKTERARFEAWVAHEYAGANINNAMIDTMWIAWQAALR